MTLLRRPALLLAATAALLLAVPAPALAGEPEAARAAEAFRSGRLVYVDPAASAVVPATDAQALERKIRTGSTPIYVAVLPAEDGAAASDDVRRIVRAVGRDGTYAVLAGNYLRAMSDVRGVDATAISRQAVQRSGGSRVAALEGFVARTQDAARSGGDRRTDPADSGSGGGGGSAVPLLLILGGGGAVAWVIARRRRRAREQAELAQVREAAGEDVTALGEDIARLDLDVQRSDLDQAIRGDYAAAIDAYDRAKAALDRAERPADLAAVSQALEEGRWRMEAVRARQEGRPVPERRPPCFFNPRHGPSVTDVQWAPPYGAPRMVPACAADAERVRQGYEPDDARQVEVGGRRVPYWQAGPAYGPWAGGFYGGWGGLGAGLLGGMLVGQMLSAPAWAGGYDAGYDAGQGDDGGHDGGGWDDGWGGGGSGDGWGGGDFGGGDFGGGDFGGGDFGGGDF